MVGVFSRANVIIYTHEVSMLIDIFFLSVKLDVIFGYNSLNFDWPYLIERYNFLHSSDIFKIFNLGYVSIFSDYAYQLKSSAIVKLKYKCDLCGVNKTYQKPKTFTTTPNLASNF